MKWHHSQKGHHRGNGLYYKPVGREHAKRSHLYEEGTAEGDAKHYRQLALSQATGWDRIALNPLRLMRTGARGRRASGRPVRQHR